VKKDPNLSDFEVFFAKFLQQVQASSQKYAKTFYFETWSVAKFGQIFLWMIPSQFGYIAKLLKKMIQ
jgi:hypothetical protein